MFHVGYITYLSWLRRDPDYSAYIKRLKAERRADMEARKAERMKNPRRARRTPAQHRVRKVSWPVPWRLRNPNSCRPSIISAGGIIFYSKTPENVVNEKGHYFDHKRKFRKTWSNTEYQPAKNQYQNSKKRLQFKRRQNCRPKCRHICLLKMSIVTIVIIRHPLNKLQFQSDQQAIKILNIEQYISINQLFTNIT